jgi:HAUS augmin-like complex subunit 1
MDSDPPWDHSTLFSPSKARAAQAQAKDWASVDAWLAKRYLSKRLPPFERNDDTLQALMELATLNDSADEQRSLVDRIEKASLQAMSRRKAAESEANTEVLRSVMAGLEECESLDALAETMVALDCSDVDVSTMGRAMVDLTTQSFEAEQQARRAEAQVEAILSDQTKLSTQLKDLRREDFEPRSNLPELTVDWTRNTKQLKAKIGEYDDRLAGLRATQQPNVKLEDVSLLAADLSTQQQRLDELNAHLKAYQSLPTDPKAARATLEAARTELRNQVKERDQLFERLVDAG